MVIAKIHNVFKNLTETEQKIASYILEFPEKIVNMTSKELASACGTVPSAVNRMCKSIGVEGFAKLKISLAARVGQEGHNENNIPFDKEHVPAFEGIQFVVPLSVSYKIANPFPVISKDLLL